MAKFRNVPLPRSEEEFVQGAEVMLLPVEVSLPSSEPTPESDALQDAGPDTKPDAGAAAPKKAAPARRQAAARDTRPRASALPWDNLDPRDKPNLNQTVRLNAFQYAQLTYLAEREERSMSQILRRLLGPALDEAIRRAVDDA